MTLYVDLKLCRHFPSSLAVTDAAAAVAVVGAECDVENEIGEKTACVSDVCVLSFGHVHWRVRVCVISAVEQ